MTWKTEWWKSLPQNIINKKELNEDSLRDLWDNIKCTNSHVIGFPDAENREKGPEKIFEEITAGNFPNVGKEIVNQVEEAQSPLQDKPKEKHVETHINQANRD